MIQSLHLQNFQSHRQTKLEFDPGVNVIIGESDTGKTSIIRALRWLVWNRPSGDTMRSTWGGKTSVAATMLRGSRDGWRIIRQKDTNMNEYHKYHVEATGSHRVYKAFGSDVPEDIREVLNIGEINLQQQLDSPFLLTSSPGEVASHFNKIARLDKIDIGTSNVNKGIRIIQSSIKFQEEELAGHKTDLENYTHLEKFEAEVEVLESLEKDYTRVLSRSNAFRSLINEVIGLGRQILETQKITQHEETVDSLLTLQEESRVLLTDQRRLSNLISDITTLETDLAEANDLLVDQQAVDNVLDLIYKRDGLEDGPRATLLTLMRDIDGTKVLQEDEAYLADKLQGQFDKSFPERCPLCDKPK